MRLKREDKINISLFSCASFRPPPQFVAAVSRDLLALGFEVPVVLLSSSPKYPLTHITCSVKGNIPQKKRKLFYFQEESNKSFQKFNRSN